LDDRAAISLATAAEERVRAIARAAQASATELEEAEEERIA
jgi:hypothetical protein